MSRHWRVDKTRLYGEHSKRRSVKTVRDTLGKYCQSRLRRSIDVVRPSTAIASHCTDNNYPAPFVLRQKLGCDLNPQCCASKVYLKNSARLTRIVLGLTLTAKNSIREQYLVRHLQPVAELPESNLAGSHIRKL